MFHRKHKRLQKAFTQPSLAKQSFRDECDINNIMRKFEKSGLVDHINTHQGQYGDFIGYPEFHEAQNSIKVAEEMFATVPAKIRAKFGNSPEAFLDFVQDSSNEGELIKMGLAHPRDLQPSTEAVAPKGTNTPLVPSTTPEASSDPG